MHPDRAQAGAFLPGLLEKAGLLETGKSADDQDKEILKLNVIVVYKKLVQGLVYSPPDCDKYLALDAKPQVSVALPATLAPVVWQCQQGLASPPYAPYMRLWPSMQLHMFHTGPSLLLLSSYAHRPTRKTSSAC